MQETKLLYTANERRGELDWGRIARWMDGLAFIGILIGVGGVLGGAILYGQPMTLKFVQWVLWGMSILLGAFLIMGLVNRFGWGVLLGVIPLVGLGIIHVVGGAWLVLVNHWGQQVSEGVSQVIVYSLYGLASITGLGLLARLIEKVGIVGVLATLGTAIGISVWLIGRL